MVTRDPAKAVRNGFKGEQKKPAQHIERAGMSPSIG